jgi:hypothetical protein
MEGVIKYLAPDTFAISGSMSMLTMPMKGTVDAKKSCTICLGKDISLLLQTECSHVYHKYCLQMALQNGGRKCPSCLAGIGEPQGKYCSF